MVHRITNIKSKLLYIYDYNDFASTEVLSKRVQASLERKWRTLGRKSKNKKELRRPKGNGFSNFSEPLKKNPKLQKIQNIFR